jgi:hypothetical protein
MRRTKAEFGCCTTEKENRSRPWAYFVWTFLFKIAANYNLQRSQTVAAVFIIIKTAATVCERCSVDDCTCKLDLRQQRYWDRHTSWCWLMQVTFHGMHTNHGKCWHDAANLQTSAPFSDKCTQAEISVYSLTRIQISGSYGTNYISVLHLAIMNTSKANYGNLRK